MSPLHAASRLVAVLVTALLVLALLPVSPGRAQESDATSEVATGPTRLVIARLTGLIGPGAAPDSVAVPDEVLIRVLVEHTGPDDLVDAEVVVESYARLTTRSLLRQALDDEAPGAPVRVHPRVAVRPGASVRSGDVAAVDVFIPVEQLVDTRSSGVYPLQVSLTRGTDVIDTVVTAVVHLAERPANPMATVAVWPIDTKPAPGTQLGTAHLDRETRVGGRLDGLTAGLEVGAGAGLIPAVSAHLLDALVARSSATNEPDDDDDDAPDPAADAAADQAADLLARLRAVVIRATMDPLAGPYAEADLSALVEAGDVLATVGGDLAVDGIRRIAAVTGRDADNNALLATAPLTPRAMELLPSDHLLLPWAAVGGADPADGEASEPLREVRTLSGRLLTASVADPWLADALSRPDLSHGTIVAVQRLLVETALTHFEAPGVPDRPLLLLPDRAWAPTGRFARDVAKALTQAPWLRMVAPEEHVALANDPLATPLAPRADRVRQDVAKAVNATLTALEAIRGSLPPGRSSIQGRNLGDLELQLRRATSHWFVGDADTALSMVADVASTIDAAYGVVQIPTDTGVTLVGKDQAIPLTIGHPEGDEIVVDVELRSGGALVWPNGDTRRVTLAPGARQTLSFDVEARARGDLRVEVIVRDASGARVLTEATIRVRSTLVSGTALAVVAGVILMLLLVGRLRRGPVTDGRPDPDDTGPGDKALQVVTSNDGHPPAGGADR